MQKRKLSSFIRPVVNRSLVNAAPSEGSHWVSPHPRSAGAGGADASAPNTDVDEPDSIIELSQKQFSFFELIARGESVFITGAAGTGKSHALKVLQEVMWKLGRSDKLVITASTGVAACNIGGLTIHSWAGVGVGSEPLQELCARVNRSRESKRNWKNVEILVIDEISILSSDLFDKLSAVGSRVRGNSRPFGGIQLVVCGDFFQLPPVAAGAARKYCFESPVWKSLFTEQNVIILDQVFRQKETTFLNVLHELRRGELSEGSRIRLEQKVRDSRLATAADEEENAIRPTVLFSTNRDVDLINETEILKLETPLMEFRAVDEGSNVNGLKSIKAPALLKLKVGAQVMLLKNLDTSCGLVNGARGVVINFVKPEQRSVLFPKVPVVRFEVTVGDKKSVETRIMEEENFEIGSAATGISSRWQLPLMLAYAISIHKSQGMTIAKLDVSFEGMFEYGQAYVALSRAVDWEGLTLKSFNVNCVKAHEQVKDFYSRYGYRSEMSHNKENTIKISTGDLVAQMNSLSAARQGAPVSGEKNESNGDTWLVSKRMKTENPSMATPLLTISTESTIYSDFACEDDWMERPKSLVAVPRANLVATSLAGPSRPHKGGPVAIWHGTLPKRDDYISSTVAASVAGRSWNINNRPTQSMETSHLVQKVPSFSRVNVPTSRPALHIPGPSADSLFRASSNETPTKPIKKELTEEQKRKIEVNRQAALLKLTQNRMRQESKEEADRFLAESLRI